jgi:hypothetical protein
VRWPLAAALNICFVGRHIGKRGRIVLLSGSSPVELAVFSQTHKIRRCGKHYRPCPLYQPAPSAREAHQRLDVGGEAPCLARKHASSEGTGGINLVEHLKFGVPQRHLAS